MEGRRRKPREDDFTVAIGDRRFDPAETPEPAPPEVEEARPSGPHDTRLVQFNRTLGQADIERLRRSYDLALTAYVPNYAYVERVPADVRAALADDPLVRTVAPYLPEYKLSPRIFDPAIEKPEEIAEDQLLLVASLFDRADPDRVVAAAEAVGATATEVLDDRPIGGLARVRFIVADDADLNAIASLDDVRFVEPVARQVDDNVGAASSIQSGDSGNASIWDRGIHGEAQVIGVIDSGPPDMDHCFFEDAPTNDPGPMHRKVLAIRNARGSDPGGHATFVAGCAAGDERGDSGGSDRRGGAWAAKLVCGNRLDLSIFGGASSMLDELRSARDSSALVHTNSWHEDTAGDGNPAAYTDTAVDVDRFTFDNEEHLVLGSAGNSGEEQGPPGTAKNAICVAAAEANLTDLGDGNPGPTADGRQKPDLVAVGCGIESATVDTDCATGPRSACATSYATPHAAAAAALVRQYFIDGWYPTGVKTAANAFTPTGALLKAVLVASTVDMTGVAGYPNLDEGWGLIRIDRALVFEGSARGLNVFDVRHAAGPTTGDTRTHTVTVGDETEQLKVAMVFNDPPGTAGVPDPLVNDLDLRVTAPDGTEYRGNDFTGTTSTPDSTDVGDPLENVEVVVVDNPATGDWTIEVEAFRVAIGDPGQGYAVAAVSKLESNCFVATAVYDDPDHRDVEALRAWRDRHIDRGWMRALAAAYERVGPAAARVVEPQPRLRAFLREHAFPRLARLLARDPGGSG